MNRAAAIAVMLAALWTTPGAAQAPGTDTDPRLERTWRAYRAGRFDEALAAARLASAALPSSGPALLAHGWMAEYLGEFDEAPPGRARRSSWRSGSLPSPSPMPRTVSGGTASGSLTRGSCGWAG